jgi:chromosome segregation ATPase
MNRSGSFSIFKRVLGCIYTHYIDYIKIQTLESRIQAYTTRVSQLQTQLLSTLDALDQVKNLQEQELVPVERENARLKAQLNRYLAVVKAAEAERDDMQDAVLKLIEKGAPVGRTLLSQI